MVRVATALQASRRTEQRGDGRSTLENANVLGLTQETVHAEEDDHDEGIGLLACDSDEEDDLHESDEEDSEMTNEQETTQWRKLWKPSLDSLFSLNESKNIDPSIFNERAKQVLQSIQELEVEMRESMREPLKEGQKYYSYNTERDTVSTRVHVAQRGLHN